MITAKSLPVYPHSIREGLKIMGEVSEINFLYHMATTAHRILEVGTGPGGSSILMARAMREYKTNGRLHTIAYQPRQEKHEYAKTAARMTEHPKTLERISIHHGKSRHVVDELKDDFFDFIYIDGDHSYEGVKQDIIQFYPKLKSYGIMGFHDTNQQEVMKAIEDTLDGELIAVVDRIKAYSGVRLKV